MAQTGVPFGEIELVRDWLRIEEEVGKPRREHPRRLIEGFRCARSEVSGRRLWGWARARFRTPERFFERFFVANYCPLCFLEESGRNRTPDRLPSRERRPLLALCDEALAETIEALRPRIVVGLGHFATARAVAALAGVTVEVGRVLHPSPASPSANRGWVAQAERELEELGIGLD
jgi:single-strand selective monofunctional uracil DNA glycosylase